MQIHTLMLRGLVSTFMASALLLVGCSKPDAPAPAQEAHLIRSTTHAPLKVAFAYVGPITDGGWTQSHELARRKLAEKFGDRIQTSATHGIDTTEHGNKAFADMVAEGNKLIIGTSFMHMQAIANAARQTPQAKFAHATGHVQADNLSTYDSRTYEGAYLAGIVAGFMTKSKVLGVVASVPIAEVRRNINSFALGAQSVNPAIQTKVMWVGEWFNPGKEAQVANLLMEQGADILLQNTDSFAVLQAAEAMGKRAFGWNSDMAFYGPQAHLGSVVIDWLPYYSQLVSDVLDGKWTSSATWWGVREDVVDLVELADDVPEQARTRLQEVKAGLRSGSFSIWQGPMLDQTGKEVIAAGKPADDAFLKKMDFLVHGVQEIGEINKP